MNDALTPDCSRDRRVLMRSETVTPARRTHAQEGVRQAFREGHPAAKQRQPRRQAERSSCPAPQCWNTTNKLSILCGLTLELSGRCRTQTVAYHRRPPGNGPLGRIVRPHHTRKYEVGKMNDALTPDCSRDRRVLMRSETVAPARKRTRGREGRLAFREGHPRAKQRQPRRPTERSPCPAPQCRTQLTSSRFCAA